MSTRGTLHSVSEEKLDVSTRVDDVRPMHDDIDERKLMRKIDWHVVPWLALLYLLNFLDRGNIGNARVSSSVMAVLVRELNILIIAVQYAK